MNYREIGKSAVRVSEVSLGCWTMGGLNWVDGKANGWANVDEGEVRVAVKRAVDAGVNHFDNADVYGNGRAERMLARVLKDLGLRSEDYVIATKVGHFPGTAVHAYDPIHIRHQCEQSLRNLERDHIDLYYFHHGNFGPYLEAAAEVMDRLVAEGKVRLKGQSAYSAEDFERAVPVVKPDVLQSWANIESRQFIDPGGRVARLLEEYGMSFVAFSPLAQGRLLGKYPPGSAPQFDEGDHRRGSPKFSALELSNLAPRMDAIRARFGDDVEILSAVAQRFVLNHDRVACTIPGFRNERQVACNLAAVDFALSEDDMAFLRSLFPQG